MLDPEGISINLLSNGAASLQGMILEEFSLIHWEIELQASAARFLGISYEFIKKLSQETPRLDSYGFLIDTLRNGAASLHG